MKIIINTHKTGGRAINRPEEAFETRIYAVSDVIGDITAVETIDCHKVDYVPERAICDAIEKFAEMIDREIASGENPGDIIITRITTALVRDNKRKMTVWQEADKRGLYV